MARVQFRDGPHEVPPHLKELMVGLDTYRLTYSEAVKKVNQKLMSDHLNQIQAKIVKESLEGMS